MNPIERYRSAAQRLRALEADATSAKWYCAATPDPEGWPIYFDDDANRCVGSIGDIGVAGDAALICASRNLLLPWIAVGDRLAYTIETDEAALTELRELGIDTDQLPNDTRQANYAALTALTEAIEREIGEAQ